MIKHLHARFSNTDEKQREIKKNKTGYLKHFCLKSRHKKVENKKVIAKRFTLTSKRKKANIKRHMIASKSEKKDNCEAFRVTCKRNKFCFEKFVFS